MKHYEVRALPRKRKEIEDEQQQPLFLRKAFNMINTCPAHIGGWSESGETFVIKDADRFAGEIIPTAFKHSKFSSFVRQLNFYGFRKVRPDAVHQAHWWEFRHPFFKQHEPNLLSKIKKSIHFEANGGDAAAASSADNSELKDEMQRMRDQMNAMEDTISELSAMVRLLMSNQSGYSSSSDTDSQKKRKFDSDSGSESFEASFLPSLEPVQDDWDELDDMDSFLSGVQFGDSTPRGEEVQEVLPAVVAFANEMEVEDGSCKPAAENDCAEVSGLIQKLAQILGDKIVQKKVAILEHSAAEAKPDMEIAASTTTSEGHIEAFSETDPLASNMAQAFVSAVGATAAYCCAREQAVAQQHALEASASTGCACPNCKLVTMDGLEGCAGGRQVPAVMYPLAVATIGALFLKWGDAYNRVSDSMHADPLKGNPFVVNEAFGKHSDCCV